MANIPRLTEVFKIREGLFGNKAKTQVPAQQVQQGSAGQDPNAGPHDGYHWDTTIGGWVSDSNPNDVKLSSDLSNKYNTQDKDPNADKHWDARNQEWASNRDWSGPKSKSNVNPWDPGAVQANPDIDNKYT